MVALILSGLLFAVIASRIAYHKGRNAVFWFVMGFFLHLFGLIVLFFPPVSKPGVTKKCPACAEIVKAEANICRYCGSGLVVADEAGLSLEVS